MAGTSSTSSPYGSALSDAGSAYALYAGIEQNSATGDAKAALSGTKLAANVGGATGVFDSGTASTLNTAAGEGADALGIYTGIQSGTPTGYAGAAVNAAKLGAAADAFGEASSTIGAVAGYAAIPLAFYNEIESYQSGNTGSDALSGAETGAAVGSMIVPGIGTLVGGVIGGAVGAVASAFGPGKTDAETTDVQSLINYTSSNNNNPAAAQSVQNPYVQLAGLFDERSSTLPMYQVYGRMGEQAFTNDMVAKINQAAASGQISASSTPQQVYNTVVAPWVSSMGAGWSNVGTTYAATTQGLLQNMVSQYMSGTASQNWKAVGGDSPFASLPKYGSSGFNGAPPPKTATGQHAADLRGPVAMGGAGTSSGVNSGTSTTTAPAQPSTQTTMPTNAYHGLSSARTYQAA